MKNTQYKKPIKKYQTGGNKGDLYSASLVDDTGRLQRSTPLIEGVYPTGMNYDNYPGSYFFNDTDPNANMAIAKRRYTTSPAVTSYQQAMIDYYAANPNLKKSLRYGADSKFGKYSLRTADTDSRAMLDWMHANNKMSKEQAALYNQLGYNKANPAGWTTNDSAGWTDNLATNNANATTNAGWTDNLANPAGWVDNLATANTTASVSNNNTGTTMPAANRYALGVTNGQWVNNYNPNASFQYRTTGASNGAPQSLANMDMMTQFAPKQSQSSYQIGGTYQNTKPSLTKPFSTGYQLPSYQLDPNRDADGMAKRMFRNNQYNMAPINAGSQLTPGYNSTLANSLNGNPLAGYGPNAAPVSSMTRDTSSPNLQNNAAQANLSKNKGGNSNLTSGEKMQLWGEFLPAVHNLAYSMIKPYQAKPAYNKYRYQVYNNMARQQAPTDNSDIYAMQNKGMRDIRSSSPNEQVERANRLALYSGTMDNLNQQKLRNFEANQQLADRATQQLGNIGEQERQANEAARVENIGHEEARDAIRMEGVGQFGTGLVDFGRFKTSAEENEMRMALMGEIYNNYDTVSYNQLINSLNNGEIDAEDLVVFKQTGSVEAAKAAKAKRDAQLQSQTTVTNQNVGVSNTSATPGLNGNIQTTVTSGTSGVPPR